ncbi:hypothetical protein PR003_g16846 [Phytophthora rubi]|uniref:Uncharacterized protein n=1 Tax=Phytophthora rubi TaxID=129364 RepID=A0A6A4EKE5_9STRA|nr:hypothetical protein PR003_g16846 [Phytophthora rubi]
MTRRSMFSRPLRVHQLPLRRKQWGDLDLNYNQTRLPTSCSSSPKTPHTNAPPVLKKRAWGFKLRVQVGGLARELLVPLRHETTVGSSDPHCADAMYSAERRLPGSGESLES